MSISVTDRRPTLEAVLDAVESFGPVDGASLRLVSWALDFEFGSVRPVWHRALQQHLLERAPGDPHRDEEMWRLSASGAKVLDDHRAGPRHSTGPTGADLSVMP